MQVRRVLLFALLGIVAVSLGASLAAPPAEREESPAPPAAPQMGDTGADPTEIAFEAVGRSARGNGHPQKRSIEQGSRVLLEVDAPEPGEVTIDGLGRVSAVEPETPARFDLLLDDPGGYEVTFTPVDGAAESVGTLSVEAAEEP